MKDEQESFVYAVQSHLNTYIKVADQKASILLTAQLAFLGLFSNALRTLFPDTGLLFHGLAALTAAAALAGIFLAGWVVYLRTQPPGADEGFFFWNDILDYPSATSYGDALAELEDDGIHDELTSENYTLAEIAQKNTIISDGRSVLRQPWSYSRLLLAGCISSRLGPGTSRSARRPNLFQLPHDLTALPTQLVLGFSSPRLS